MGSATLSIDGLMNPFKYLEEWYLTISPGQSLEVSSSEFKMVLFLEGETVLSVSGMPEIELHKGDAYSLSLPKTQTYRSLRPEREMHLHFLRLVFRWPLSSSAATLKMPSIRSGPEIKYETALRRQLTGFQLFPHKQFGEHYSISRRILSEMEHRDDTSAWKISGLCQTLTAGLLSPSHSPDPQKRGYLPGRQKNSAIQYVLHYLQENCHEALMLDAVAGQVQLSGEHLARIFKQETGQTVFTWLDHFRTEKARDLLVTTEWSLARIAHACGYSSSNLLIRHFRKNTGFPPIAYRVKVRKSESFLPGKLSPLANPQVEWRW